MNRSYFKALSAVLALVLALCACTDNDTERAVQGGSPDGAIRFSLTGTGGNGATRAGVQSDREKAVTSVYVAAFSRSTGKFAVGTEAEDISTTAGLEGDWRAKLGSAASFDVYFVANADAALKAAIGGLTPGEAAEGDFFALIASQDPGTSATDGAFLMTSEKVAVTVDNTIDGTLLASPVTVTRASARIDVAVGEDVSIKEINSVELQNRYVKTKVARTGTDTDMTGLTAEDRTYTVGDPDVTELRGAIYAYEDPTKSTVVKITAKLTDGTVVTPTVRFDGGNEDIALQRNRLYTVTLVGSDDSSVGGVGCTIDVKDWTEAEAVSYEGLSDRLQPSFTVTSAHDGTDYTASDAVAATKTNPGAIVTDGTVGTTVTLEVTGSRVGSRLVCRGRFDPATGTTVTATGVTIQKTGVTNDGTGNIRQQFTVTLEDNAVEYPGYLVFRLMNELDQTRAYRDFNVVSHSASIGDYYYSDGTWSTERAESKTVIGLVFCNTPTADDVARGYKNGYVIALKDYADAHDTKWADNVADVAGIMDDYSITQANQFGGAAINTTLSAPASIDLNGLTNTLKIAAKASGKTYGSDATLKLSDITDDTYHAAYKAVNFASSTNGVAAPAKSSGWYLPSIGQQYLWLWNFGNVKTVPQNFRASYADCYWNNPAAPDAGSVMNTYFANKVGEGNFALWDATRSGKTYWSSTVRSASGYPFCLLFGNTAGNLDLDGYYSALTAVLVRPVLAF